MIARSRARDQPRPSARAPGDAGRQQHGSSVAGRAATDPRSAFSTCFRRVDDRSSIVIRSNGAAARS
jgi:hypothetical protein